MESIEALQHLFLMEGLLFQMQQCRHCQMKPARAHRNVQLWKAVLIDTIIEEKNHFPSSVEVLLAVTYMMCKLQWDSCPKTGDQSGWDDPELSDSWSRLYDLGLHTCEWEVPLSHTLAADTQSQFDCRGQEVYHPFSWLFVVYCCSIFR